MPTSDHTTLSDSGVYRFVCVSSGKCYVGSSAHMLRRKGEHLSCLRGNRHHSKAFQHSWNKYRSDAFIYEVLEYVAADDLMSREQFWIDHFRSAEKTHGFNSAPVAGSVLGIKRCEETKEKMRISRRKRVEKPFSEAHKANLSKSLIGNQRTKGHKLTDEHKAKVSLASKGKPRPYLSVYWRGRPKSAEHLAQIAAAKQAKKRRVGPNESQGMLF